MTRWDSDIEGEMAMRDEVGGAFPREGVRPAAEIWADLTAKGRALTNTRIVDLFGRDADRFMAFSAAQQDMLLDYSKEKIDRDVKGLLIELAHSAGLDQWRERMFAGEIVNGTERRAARHNLLRERRPSLAGVADMREQFLEFAEDVRSGKRLGVSGKRFTDIVNIGIGGSFLGPKLAVDAMAPFADGPRIHFVSNVDPWQFHRTVDELDPARTLFICASKSFTTQETMLNTRAALDWAATRLGPKAVEQHFCAITAKPEVARQHGFAPENIFQIWDWAGGRFSIWSSMGVCVAIRAGRRNFEAFLGGGAEIDQHFREAPLEHNLPVLLALIGIWRRNVMKQPAYVLSPYEDRLAAFPDYIQQLEMESNGKSVNRDGEAMELDTAPVVFGGAGTNTQHSFFQKLHQGTDVAPVDFIVGAETPTAALHAQAVLLANCLAQSKALMTGLSEQEARERLQAKGMDEAAVEKLAPHMACPGDRPSTTLMYKSLDPRTLGRLIALYEHKIFAQSVIWGIECFDQWGVELGKRLTEDLLRSVDEPEAWEKEDASTGGLLAWRKSLMNG